MAIGARGKPLVGHDTPSSVRPPSRLALSVIRHIAPHDPVPHRITLHRTAIRTEGEPWRTLICCTCAGVTEP